MNKLMIVGFLVLVLVAGYGSLNASALSLEEMGKIIGGTGSGYCDDLAGYCGGYHTCSNLTFFVGEGKAALSVNFVALPGHYPVCVGSKDYGCSYGLGYDCGGWLYYSLPDCAGMIISSTKYLKPQCAKF